MHQTLEQFIVPDETTHILQGQYTVDYKTIEQPTGTLIFAHEVQVNGQIAQNK